MADDIEWDTLDRYFAGECTPAESAAIARWAAADPAHARRLESIRAVWAASATLPVQPVDVDVAWRTMQPALDEPVAATVTPIRFGMPLGAPRVGHALRYAAAAVLVAALGLGLLARLTQHQERAPAAVALREFATSRGQRADFRLPDGTHVVLSAASTLRMPADYNTSARYLYLEGEAYFEVTHDAGRRFLVHTANAVTEDLGTRFVVRSYPDDSTTRVIVAEGRVQTANGAGSATLVAGDLAQVPASGAVTVHHRVELDRYMGWTDGRLVFQNTPLADALPELSRWYDLEFRLAEPALAGRRLTAVFRTQPSPEILGLLAASLDVRYEQQGRIVTFYSQHRNR